MKTDTTIPDSPGKIVLHIQELTEDQIRKDGRDYNASEWDRIIDRHAKYKNCKFYVAKKDDVFEYDRYFATYEIEEGIILFKSVSYSSGLTSRGFCRITISPSGVVRSFMLKDVQGNEGRCENTPENRKIMASNSQKFGAIFSNNF